MAINPVKLMQIKAAIAGVENFLRQLEEKT